MKRTHFVVLAVTLFFLSCNSWAQTSGKTADRLYVLDCGQGHAADESRWTVGVNVGKPIDISDSCYLIHHANSYVLWDTGISDAVASMPDGWLPTNNPATDIHWTRAKTLESQLVAIGVQASDIRFIGISHTHPDHIGNIELFPQVRILIQKAEYDYYFAPGKEGILKPPSDARPTFLKDHPVQMVQEDLDIFGDGSVMIIYTPGHTPGHQSCLVHLPKTGWVLLSGDAVHLQENWDNRRIPYFSTMPTEQKIQTQLSMQRMADLISFYHAQLWINHEKTQSDKLKHAPAYYD
ncbi:MAG TPA: N-acyl homoserine lactonase family protein [Candidatus Acidoferrales bacterium]|jgi:glyoxylase-like metal-dependent hydrolase (beta-lactamase superfamily II)|nr:N-acyl homoserine lactonase family protein [Candidatus Acidoferrales bacterium]